MPMMLSALVGGVLLGLAWAACSDFYTTIKSMFL